MGTSSTWRLTVTILAAMLLMAIVPGLQSTRAAVPWYVAPGGDDGDNCSSTSAPCASINGEGEILARTAIDNNVSPVNEVVINGPSAGYSEVGYSFTAAAGPVTATLPITYTWEATEHSPATDILYSLTDLITFTWNTTGTKFITVTAMNIRDGITSSHAVSLESQPKIYLPLIFKKLCSPLYADDFSNPASGWSISDDGNIRREYLNGEYRMLVREEDWTALARPGVQFSDYILEVDVRNATGIYGSYGLAFGVSNAGDQFYTFEIDPNQGFDIWRYNATTGWTDLSSGTSFSINWGTAWNHLKVIRNGSQISVYANGQVVAIVNNGSYLGSRGVGLITSSHSQSNVDARFDNFAVYALQCGEAVRAGADR
jgi:hypothetical protein